MGMLPFLPGSHQDSLQESWPTLVGMHQLGKVRHFLHGGEGRTKSRPFVELLLCRVTKGKLLLPIHFPTCWALPRRQSMLGQAQFSLGIFQKWKRSQPEVSSYRRGAGNASSIIGAQGRRCMRLIYFRCLWRKVSRELGVAEGWCHSNRWVPVCSAPRK